MIELFLKTGYAFQRQVNVAVSRATFNYRLEAVKYLLSNNFSVNDIIYTNILIRYKNCSSEQREILRRIISCISEISKISLTLTHFYMAMEAGCLELVKLLHNLKCPWDEIVFARSVANSLTQTDKVFHYVFSFIL